MYASTFGCLLLWGTFLSPLLFSLVGYTNLVFEYSGGDGNDTKIRETATCDFKGWNDLPCNRLKRSICKRPVRLRVELWLTNWLWMSSVWCHSFKKRNKQFCLFQWLTTDRLLKQDVCLHSVSLVNCYKIELEGTFIFQITHLYVKTSCLKAELVIAGVCYKAHSVFHG